MNGSSPKICVCTYIPFIMYRYKAPKMLEVFFHIISHILFAHAYKYALYKTKTRTPLFPKMIGLLLPFTKKFLGGTNDASTNYIINDHYRYKHTRC